MAVYRVTVCITQLMAHTAMAHHSSSPQSCRALLKITHNKQCLSTHQAKRIWPSMLEHDGCHGCKHAADRTPAAVYDLARETL